MEPITLDELAKQWIERSCSNYLQCHQFETREACEAATTYDLEQLIASVKAGRATFDPEHAAECLEGISDATSCSDVLSASRETQEKVRTCYGSVLVGNGDEGAPCVAWSDCVSNSCSAPSCAEGCCAGSCTAPSTGTPPTPNKDGEACGNGAGICDDAKSFCPYSAPPLVCTPKSALDGPCTGDEECLESSLYCAKVPGGKGVCKKRGGPGEACDPGTVPYLNYHACDRNDTYCDLTTKVCTSKPLAGASCDTDLGKICVGAAWCDQGQCVSRSAAGAGCDANLGGYNCPYGTRCTKANICDVGGKICP
jgi:hypothetical protein